MDPGLDAETVQRLESFIGEWVTDANVPGASIAIVERDDVVYTSGFGSRDLEANQPATPATLYGIASCSKSFASLAIQILEERDELSVEDPVGEHVGEFDLEGLDGEITIHDLLTHTSGLPSLKTSEVLLSRLTELAERAVPLGDREDFYRHLNQAQDEITDPQGERTMYNNSGYIVLGMVVGAVTGQSFADFVEAAILDPLGMERSTFDIEEVDDDVMTPHFLDEGTPEPTPFPHRELSYAAGGLIAPVTELTNYLRMQMNGGTFEGTDLVSSDRLGRAHEAHTERYDGPYGYGWQQADVLDRTLVGHGGSLGVSSAYIGFTQDGEYAIAIGANTTPEPTPPTVAQGVVAILDGEKPAETVPFFKRKAVYDELTGEYESYRGITTATVEEHAGVLQLTVDSGLGEQELILVPTNPEDPGYMYEIPRKVGSRIPAEFEVHEDHVDLFFERNRLHQV